MSNVRTRWSLPWWVALVAPIALIVNGLLFMDGHWHPVSTSRALGGVVLVIGVVGVVFVLGQHHRAVTR